MIDSDLIKAGLGAFLFVVAMVAGWIKGSQNQINKQARNNLEGSRDAKKRAEDIVKLDRDEFIDRVRDAEG